VQDDSTFTNPLLIMALGERNAEDSRRKAAATAAGRRRAAERGEWCGNVPDGYRIERTPQGATIERCVVKDEERIEVYTLLFDLMREGATVNQVVAEFRRRGFRTAPLRARRRPFDAVRLNKAITNPFYAGLMVSKGEIIGEGNWQPYVELDEWHRLQGERRERVRHQPRPVGRPPTGLLARLVRCGACGGAVVQQRSGARKDGSRRRTYTCQRHMHGAGACTVKPFDAEQVESLILDGLDRLLGDVEAWAEGLLAGRDAERARLEAVVTDAAREAAAAEASIERLSARYERAITAGDRAETDLAKRAWETQRQTVERAAVRQQAAEDALVAASETVVDHEAASAHLWRSLSGDLAMAKDERVALNEALRRWFDAFVLHRVDGELSIVPMLSGEGVAQALRDRTHRVTATLVGDAERGADLLTMLSLPGADSAAPSRMAQAVVAEDGSIASHMVHELSEGRAMKVLREAVAKLAEQGRFDPRVSISAEGPALSGSSRPSRLPHNTRPDSWRGTAGGGPRRSRSGGRGRRGRSRS
jgi:hypothetical protein